MSQDAKKALREAAAQTYILPCEIRVSRATGKVVEVKYAEANFDQFKRFVSDIYGLRWPGERATRPGMIDFQWRECPEEEKEAEACFTE